MSGSLTPSPPAAGRAAPAVARPGRAAPAPAPDRAVAPVAGPAAQFVRIAVAGPAGRADLAVPAGVPLAHLMPTLLHHAGGDSGDDGGVRHGGWVLRRTDGTRLDPAATLAAQGVREGDLLFAGHGTDDATEPLYDDVVEVIGEHGVRGTWAHGATRAACGALATVAVLTVCGALAAAPGRLPGWLGLALAAAALAVAALMSRAFGDTRAGTLAAVLAAPAAMTGAVRLLGTGPGLDGFGAGHLLLACAVLAVVGGLGPLLAGGGDGTFAALVTAGPPAAAGAAICAIWGAEPALGAAVAAPLALALTTVWPTLALRLARTPAPYVAGSAEDLAELPPRLSHDALRDRVARARLLLTGMLAGSHLVAGAGTLALFASRELWPSVLGAVLVLLTALRTRLFKDARQAAVPLVTALLATAGAAALAVTSLTGQTLPLLGATVPVAVTAALAAGTVAVLAGRYRLNPRLSRALDVLETAVLLTVVPLVLAVWEVYAALLNFRV
ncbi:type VII secretion integral membrane protein EccD [Streptomyces sodiiphilus]|uniref:Type VII secretion integral membrane protein EccD n=1 Tax=Streptomyces sodiiphilus TaxID=226217 RepID=A0ABN2PAJ5_9ACTN